jgi:hypothetical protein
VKAYKCLLKNKTYQTNIQTMYFLKGDQIQYCQARKQNSSFCQYAGKLRKASQSTKSLNNQCLHCGLMSLDVYVHLLQINSTVYKDINSREA